MAGWEEVTQLAAARLATSDSTTPIAVATDTGPIQVTLIEWQQVLLAAASYRQPIWAASFALQAMDPMRAIMFGVSRSCRVLSVEANVSVTLTEDVTTAIASKNVAFVDDSPAFHGNKLQAALKASGWNWGRSTINGNMFCQYGISRDQALQFPSNSTTGLTLASFQTIVNAAIASKSMTSFYIHNVADSGGNNWTISEFTNCMTWLKDQIDAGLVISATTPMLDKLYGNAHPPA